MAVKGIESPPEIAFEAGSLQSGQIAVAQQKQTGFRKVKARIFYSATGLNSARRNSIGRGKKAAH
jgi:hypothetical protein